MAARNMEQTFASFCSFFSLLDIRHPLNIESSAGQNFSYDTAAMCLPPLD